MASVQLTYNQIRDRVQQRSPGTSNLGIDGLAAELQVPSIQIAQPDPIFIEIDAFRPQDGFTSEARTDIELQELLGINTNTQENTYAGKQILINSGRIILNSYDDYLMLFSSDGIAVSSKGTFNVDTDEEITLFGDQGLFLGVPNKGLPLAAPSPTPQPQIEQNAPDQDALEPQTGAGTPNDPVKVNVNATQEEGSLTTQRDLAKAELSALGNERDVATPDRDYDPLILGNKLADWLSDLILTIQTLQINTPAGPGYISAGDSQYNLKKLNARIPEMISTYAYVDGRSHLKVDDPGPPPPQDPNDNLSGLVQSTSGILPTDTFEGIDENDLEILPNVVGVKTNNGTIPPEFVILPGKQPALRATAVAFIAMAKAAKAEAGINLSVVSGFRPAFGPNLTAQTNKGRTITITTQEALRRQRSRWSGRSSWTGDDDSFVLQAGSSKFSPQTAPPGKSNHGNGTALDLNTGTKDSNTLNVAIYSWLCKNSFRFGFVRAVRSEEWHFEYIGTQAATSPYVKVSASNANRFYSELGLDKLA